MVISPGNRQYLSFSERSRFSTLLIGLLLLISATHLHANSMDQALVAFRAGYYELAARDLRTSIAKDPSDLQALYWLARCEIATGDFIGAETHLRQVLAQKPQAVESRYWLGEALAGQNRLSEAESAYQQVLAADPGYVLATQALERLSERPANVEEYNPRGRSGFSVTGLDLDFNAAELLSSNVYDYTFSSAPTDWLARGGLWNATNRWSCSPQWSWYGGYSPTGIAALWNKREFVGDIVVELYCAFTMRQGRNPSYLPPNDVNITICGDGANPDSGYSFIVGGDDNRVT
ncbi:MAG: tetratricopeptide repeat protein, partial [candidate division WS1 bacterium]|nr:tetratricopeptide repeat protein [candidate division WS1 bacterium]